mmetsp:Transcript_27933/g.70643  ORF Transcript_27933/g.70643 Transcript_27933/m.70643 type:complete len:100 (-) Transcript_27933:286-585(-)
MCLLYFASSLSAECKSFWSMTTTHQQRILSSSGLLRRTIGCECFLDRDWLHGSHRHQDQEKVQTRRALLCRRRWNWELFQCCSFWQERSSFGTSSVWSP